MLFEQGHIYVGGADVPFFVTKSMMISAGKDNGFDQIQIYDKDKFPTWSLPPGSIPPDGDWNMVARGVRVAPTGNVVFPPEVEWVVDITPTPIITAGPTGLPSPQPLPAPGPDQPYPMPDWMQPVHPLPNAGGPVVNVPKGLAMPMLIGFGVIGGSFFAYQAMNHMFRVGLTSKERRNILLYTASIAAVWGLSQLMDIDKAWWASEEGMAEKAAEKAKEFAP